MRLPGAFALIAISLAGCAGSAGTSSSAGTVPAPNALQASVAITIPMHTSASEKPAYVSPSTQSISIAIAPSASCSACSAASTLNANLTPTSPGCNASGGATTCSIPMQLRPGSYTANVATYDQTGEAGNQLSSNQSLSFTIAANTANTVPIALSGIPASLTLAVSGTPPATFASNALTIDGTGTSVVITATTKDADGNTIVGAGAPTIASAVVSGNTNYSTQTSASSFTLKTPAKGSRVPATVTVTMSAPNCPAAPACSKQITAAMTEFVAVGAQGGNLTEVYSERTQTWTAGVAGSAPYAVAFDSKGNLFVANQNGNSVTEFAPPYTGSPVATLTGFTLPNALALDSNDDLFVAAQQGLSAVLLEYAPPYSGTPVSFGSFSAVDQILVDSKNDVWITENTATSDIDLFPAPANPANAVTIPVTNCYGITQDGAGDVDVSCASDNSIHEYTTAGVSVSSAPLGQYFDYLYPMPGAGALDVIGSLSSSGSNHASYLDSQANTLNTIDTNGADPAGMAFDANKLMYVVDYRNGTVATLAYPYTATAQLLQSGLSNARGVAIWP